MECSRCCLQPVIHAFTQANLENSLGRMKTKQIIAAVNNLKDVFKGVCTQCQVMPSETNKLIEDLRKVWNDKFSQVAKSVLKDNEAMRPVIEELQQAFQVVCLTCARVSNDDNPSNHGQTFVSLDSGNCQADSGRAKTTHTDDNIVQSRADWIGIHKALDVEESSFGMSPVANIILQESPEEVDKLVNATSTMLPPEVEDKLRMEFSNFVELDIIDKLLLCCIMSGMNIAEFAKMLWLPYSIVDPKTRQVKSITKQAAHARWMNICKRFPVFMSVAVANVKDNKKAMARLRKFLDDPNGAEPSDRFQNGRISAYYAKAARKAKEEAIRRKAAKKKSLKKRDEILRKGREQQMKARMEAKKNTPKTTMKAKPAEETCFLPGFN